MASKKKQKGMVFQQEGATTPAAASAADHPPTRIFVPKPGKASEGGMERSTPVTNEEADMMGKPNMYLSKESIRASDGFPAVKHPTSSNPPSDNLSPDSVCRGIKVTLDNNGMWNEFFRCKTEMILTKQGSRMFPYCRFRISGLQPSRKYSLFMDIQPLDNSRYKWTGKSWQVAGKAERHVKGRPFAHPESPSTGQHWMQNPVSFYKLKLTNSISEQEGNTVLHPMHRYLPRLHVVQTDKAAKDVKLTGPSVVTFTFHQTEFMAVTAYQNSRLSQLKVDYNPFAKGLKEEGSTSCALKLKLNSGKDSLKAGGSATNEQHPIKKSLKSLLANHKPRSSKGLDAKPSGSGDLQKNSPTKEDQSAASITGENSCSNPCPAQKLFSELIREAHVSLHRCNLEQLGNNNSISHRTEQSNTKTTVLKSNQQDVPKRDRVPVQTHSEAYPAGNRETVTKRKVKEDKDVLNSANCKDGVCVDSSVAASARSQNSSVDSDHQSKPVAPSGRTLKQHKRPLPLPALALFLKQHSTKCKVAKNKLDSPPSDFLSDPQSSASNHASKATGPLKDLTADITESNRRTSRYTGAHLHPDEIVLNVAAHKPSSPSCPDVAATTEPTGLRTDDILGSFSVAESTGPEPAVPDGTPVLPNSDQPFCTLGMSTSIISSTLAPSPIPSPPLNTVLPAPTSPQTPTITESSALSSDSPTIKSDSLLPDPECSSFGFEPLSPASSPEPLPSLPISLALDLDSSTSESPPKAVPPQEFQHSENSAISVFKWHTVLPPPEPYIDTSFTTFQSTPQALPLESVTSPLLPSQTPSEPQTLDPSISIPPSDQEHEPSLPFSAELSPLALQMPLSPTFSSLDGDGLSPTPSIADLVHFFSTNDDLGMGVEFSNTEPVAVPCPLPSTVDANAHEPPQPAQPIPAKKPGKHTKKSRKRKLAIIDEKTDASTYTKMQPNLEEVEEQLFISFTSKEALQLHVVDSSDGTVSQPQTTPEGHLQQRTDTPAKVETEESEEETIAAFQRILQRDLKLMRHGQVIHPVLQEVGLKMNLLDPTLAIDLQYLGVRLPIPPPGVTLEPLPQELPPAPGVSAAFVSRTGKTTDVTQIKGWREKYTPSEAPTTPTPDKPEAGPSSDPPKKNLSAFCSDMLDEYLENEGKLIDERAASFSQPVVEPVVYELPTRSTSYVRTLDSILKKQTTGSPTSDLISGFIPPSKRSKLSLRETKPSRRPRGPKPNKFRAEPAPGPAPALSLSPAASNLVPKPPAVQIPAAPPSSESVAEPHKSRKHHLKVRFDHTEMSTLSLQSKKRKRLKPKTLSQTLSPPKLMAPPPSVSEDMAPLESDSELGTAANQNDETCQKASRPLMTRALLRQKDLEDGVVWEGQPRTSITEERAAIALTSLFTLKGFVSENPTAPIRLVRRRAPPCLNECCRLGCICSSLAYCSRISHCGRPQCMLGCNCLKQKVVLLKNLDGSDSSPSQQGHGRRRRRKRRMKMAYVLKEADSVSQPAERVRTLWKRGTGDSDPDQIHIPEPAPLLRATIRKERGEDGGSSCARVRVFVSRKKRSRKRMRRDLPESADHLTETPKDVKSKDMKTKDKKRVFKQKALRQRDSKTRPVSPPAAGDAGQPAPSDPPPSPEPKPSKRLVIVAECKWANDSDRNLVLKTLCEAMAQDRLDDPFWIRDYLISPMNHTVEVNGDDRCIHYKIHISRPDLDPEKPAKPVMAPQPRKQRETQPQQQHLKQEVTEAPPPEDWQREVEEEEEEPLEDWQRELEDGDLEEEAGSADDQVHDGGERSRQETISKRKMVSMALPFLTGVSPAGFLSANRKQPGGTDHLVQVNGKLYPLAKIQLGKMGALHPANRLAAYLTGRVGSNRKSLPSKPPQNQSSGPKPPTISPAPSVAPTPPPSSQPPIPVITLPAPPTAAKVDQSAASSDQPAGDAPEGAGTRVVTVRVYPGLKGEGSQVKVLPATPASSTPTSGSQVSSSVAPPVNPDPKGSQLLMLQVPPPSGKPPVPGRAPCPPTLTTSTGQRMVLKPVQMVSGVQYYRRPDGKLVQLVPISQLRSVNPNPSVQRVLPAASLQTSVSNQTTPTTVTSVLPSSSSSLSGLQSFSMSPLTSPIRLTSGFLAQKRTCTFKILPPGSNKDPIVVTCPKVPPKVVTAVPGSFTILQPQPSPAATATPVNFISLKPSTGQGAELGVKTVAVSGTPVAPSGVVVHQIPAILQTPVGTKPSVLPPAPPASEVIPVHPLEPACDPVDLDIICVDDDKEPPLTLTSEQSLVVEELEGSSSETEHSSDFGDESASDENEEEEKQEEEEKELVNNNNNHRHNMLEKQRRRKLHQLFEDLRREVGLMKARTSKIATLKTAVQKIQELRTSEIDLKKERRRLTKRRDKYLSIIAPMSESSQVSSRRQRSPELSEGGTGSKHGAEVVDLSDEMTEDSSDEEELVTKTANVITVTNAKNEVQSVAVETVKESSRLSTAKRKLVKIARNVDSDNSSVKKLVGFQSVSSAVRALRSAMNSSSSPQTLLLKQAHQEIQSLQRETDRLRSQKICLNQQRDAFIREISIRSGQSEQRIQRKLQCLSSKQKKMEEGHPGGGASELSDSSDDDISMTLSGLQRQTPQAPPTPATPTATPVPTPVQQPQRILQPVPAPPAVSHNAPVVRDRPRTIPNILSRSKNPPASPSFQAVVPLVGAPLPGQPVLTVSPLMAGPTVLQTTPPAGMTSLTLNVPSLTNQQIHLTSLPRPPTGKIYSSSAPLNVTNLTAADLNNLLQLVQPATNQHQQPQQWILQPAPPATAPPPPRPPPQQFPATPPLRSSAGSDFPSDQDQPESAPASSSPCPCPRTDHRAEAAMGGPLGTEQQDTGDDESLTSLLNEIVFLNQQTITSAGASPPGKPSSEDTEVGGATEQGHAQSPWLLELDSESDDQTETPPSQSQPGSANGSANVLAPPPLLQMKVGGAKLADPASSDGRAGGEEEGGGGGGRKGGGVTWRPMPRLVPLGLRGNPPC